MTNGISLEDIIKEELAKTPEQDVAEAPSATLPVVAVSDLDPRTQGPVRGLIKQAVDEFILDVTQFGEDPIEFTQEAAASLVTGLKSFGTAIKEGKFDIAGSIAAGEILPKFPVVGPILRVVPRDVREVIGGAAGKQADILAGTREPETIQESLLAGTAEQITGKIATKALAGTAIGRGIADLPSRVLPVKPFSETITTPQQTIDAAINRKSAIRGGRTTQEAFESIGAERLPVVFEVGEEAAKKQATKLAAKVQASAKTSAEQSALFKRLTDNQQVFRNTILTGAKSGKDFSKVLSSGIDDTFSSIKQSTAELSKRNNELARSAEDIIPVTRLSDSLTRARVLAGPETDKNADKVFAAISKVITDPNTGLTKQNITINDLNNIDGALTNLSQRFAPNKEVQAEINGMIGTVKRDVLDPIADQAIATGQLSNEAKAFFFNQADVAEQLASRQKVTQAAKTLGLDISKRKSFDFTDESVINNATKSLSNWTATKELFGETNPQAVESIKDAFQTDIFSKASVKGNVTADGLEKVLAKKADVIEDAFGPEYLRGLRDVQIALETTEQAPTVLKALAQFEDTGDITKELPRFVGARLAGQTLKSRTILSVWADRSISALFGSPGGIDKKLLEKLTGDSGVQSLKKSLTTTIADPEAYATYVSLATHLGFKPLKRVMFNEVIESLEQAEQAVTGAMEGPEGPATSMQDIIQQELGQ